MKRNEIAATGSVNDKGGLMIPMGELNQFFREHKGERIVARFVALPQHCSEAFKGYYFHYVVPTVKAALWDKIGERKTEEQVEKYLREMSPICCEEDIDYYTGEYTTRLKEIPELSNAELLEHLEFLRQFAAEELDVFIEDPKTL